MKLVLMLIICGLVVGQRNQYYGNPDEVVFPGPISSRNRQIYSRGRANENANPQTSLSKSISLAIQLNELESMDEFLNLLDEVPANEKNTLMASRIGGEERTSASSPVPAKCMPELQPVPFKTNENDHSVVYYPPCTRIKRCGGCCGHSLLSCQPLTTEIRNFVVVASKVNGDGKLKYKSKEIVPLEEHTSCKCQCRIKPEDCTDKQQYVRDECMCRCVNSDEEAKCRSSNETKLWDPDGCTCLCRVIEECNTGYFFDQNSCRCQQISRNWFEGPNYKFPQGSGETPPEIVPLSASDPRRRHKDEPND